MVIGLLPHLFPGRKAICGITRVVEDQPLSDCKDIEVCVTAHPVCYRAGDSEHDMRN